MNYHEYFDSFLQGGKDKNRRKVKGNTYAERLANGNIGLRFHATMVCEYWPNGNVTLWSGGWQTVTTQDRINNNSPVRVYSNKGSWAIWHADDPITAPKIQKCRVCKGTGVGKGWHCQGARTYGYQEGRYQEIPLEHRKPCEHGSMASHTVPGKPGACHRCNGEGVRDYGSKAIPTSFYDGIVVDMSGKVISEPYAPSVNLPVVKGGASVSGDTIVNGLASVIPGLKDAIAHNCPVDGCISPNLPVVNAVMHLNDSHQWTRGQIADWLETLDADLSFKVS